MMVSVVNDGTGHAPRRSPASRWPARPAPRRTRPARHPHAWFIAFAPAAQAKVAVAVLVENGGGNNDATGGEIAAPIASAVMQGDFGRIVSHDPVPCSPRC